MDRAISAATKSGIFGATWKSDVEFLKNVKNECAAIKNIEIFLPYVACRQNNSKSNLDFSYIEKQEMITDPHEIYYATLFLREENRKQSFGIELVANVEVIPQFYSRKHIYYYEWNKQKLLIRRMLGTYVHNKIEKMIKELMGEYKRFYLMYCKTK